MGWATHRGHSVEKPLNRPGGEMTSATSTTTAPHSVVAACPGRTGPLFTQCQQVPPRGYIHTPMGRVIPPFYGTAPYFSVTMSA